MKLESLHNKPLDANIENNDLEGIYRDNNQQSNDDMSSYDLLFKDNYRTFLNSLEIVDDDDKSGIMDGKGLEDEIRKQIEESSLYSAEDIGKYTINTPIKDKKMAENQDRLMEHFEKSVKEFADSVGEIDMDKEVTNEALEKIGKVLDMDW